MAKHKIASISLTVRDRAIPSQFSTHRVSSQGTLCNFQKNFPSPKNGGHFEFSDFCQKMAKHKLAFISLTVRDRAISSKFSTHRVCKEGTLCNSQKNFPSTKMAAILYFRIFMSADLSVSWHYVVTLRRGRTRTRPREQLLLQNYKA